MNTEAETMANAPKPPTRRAFLNLCLIGGGAAAASAGLLNSSAHHERRGHLTHKDIL